MGDLAESARAMRDGEHTQEEHEECGAHSQEGSCLSDCISHVNKREGGR